MSERWPQRLWIVRHGQSAGNLARDAANAAHLDVIDIAERDVDVSLSALGIDQARALGDWFAKMDPDARPTAVLTSPYLRSRHTAQIIADCGGVTARATMKVDERLREREFGVLDRLTRIGIEKRFPEQAAARARVGKFYHRPPGGESWCDVILRLRSVLDTISLHYSAPDSRMLIVAHQVIVLCFRYLIEELTEDEILAIDRSGDVMNCAVTSYRRVSADKTSSTHATHLELERYNFVAPLERAGAAVTAEPDAQAGAP